MIPQTYMREKGVLLLDAKDHKAKNIRNTIIAICVIATILTAGIAGCALACVAYQEWYIRHLNTEQHPDLPYHKCVALSGCFVKYVMYNEKRYENSWITDKSWNLEGK